jgi:hypothetical protein
MPGFMIRIASNNQVWYMIGAILFLLLGIGLAIGGFAALGAGWGVAGIVVAAAAVIFVIDAAMNFG